MTSFDVFIFTFDHISHFVLAQFERVIVGWDLEQFACIQINPVLGVVAEYSLKVLCVFNPSRSS